MATTDTNSSNSKKSKRPNKAHDGSDISGNTFQAEPFDDGAAFGAPGEYAGSTGLTNAAGADRSDRSDREYPGVRATEEGQDSGAPDVFGSTYDSGGARGTSGFNATDESFSARDLGTQSNAAGSGGNVHGASRPDSPYATTSREDEDDISYSGAAGSGLNSAFSGGTEGSSLRGDDLDASGDASFGMGSGELRNGVTSGAGSGLSSPSALSNTDMDDTSSLGARRDRDAASRGVSADASTWLNARDDDDAAVGGDSLRNAGSDSTSTRLLDGDRSDASYAGNASEAAGGFALAPGLSNVNVGSDKDTDFNKGAGASSGPSNETLGASLQSKGSQQQSSSAQPGAGKIKEGVGKMAGMVGKGMKSSVGLAVLGAGAIYFARKFLARNAATGSGSRPGATGSRSNSAMAGDTGSAGSWSTGSSGASGSTVDGMGSSSYGDQGGYPMGDRMNKVKEGAGRAADLARNALNTTVGKAAMGAAAFYVARKVLPAKLPPTVRNAAALAIQQGLNRTVLRALNQNTIH